MATITVRDGDIEVRGDYEDRFTIKAVRVASALPTYHRTPDDDERPVEELAASIEIESLTDPWQHQKEGVSLIEARDGSLLLWEMGTGKTKAVVPQVVEFLARRVMEAKP